MYCCIVLLIRSSVSMKRDFDPFILWLILNFSPTEIMSHCFVLLLFFKWIDLTRYYILQFGKMRLKGRYLVIKWLKIRYKTAEHIVTASLVHSEKQWVMTRLCFFSSDLSHSEGDTRNHWCMLGAQPCEMMWQSTRAVNSQIHTKKEQLFIYHLLKLKLTLPVFNPLIDDSLHWRTSITIRNIKMIIMVL